MRVYNLNVAIQLLFLNEKVCHCRMGRGLQPELSFLGILLIIARYIQDISRNVLTT